MRTELAVWMDEGETILVMSAYSNSEEGHKKFLADVVHAMSFPELGEPSESALAESRMVLEQYMDAPSELERVEEDDLMEGIPVTKNWDMEDIRNKIVNWHMISTGEIDGGEE